MAIAKRFPELALRLPRFRKPWMSEDYRMSIFDAAAFGLAYFRSRNEQKLNCRKRIGLSDSSL
jgi:hypothetical protein